MFCPDCGSENSRVQKFCNRCGANLQVVDQARSIISELGATGAVDGPDWATVLKLVKVISILGFIVITGGTIVLSAMQSDFGHGPPIGFFFALGGFGVLWLIIRRLLALVDRSGSKAPARVQMGGQRNTSPIPEPAPRAIQEPNTQPIYSVVEDRTKQLER